MCSRGNILSAKLALPSEASSVELLGSLENEFTPQQIANFKQAFSVFDVNKDGRISTQEIFEVLHTMGNEVTPERQAKIRSAVVAVDLDQSGDLDFAEFIQFMKIMDEHNKVEAVERKSQQEQAKFDERASWKYFSLFDIKIKLRKQVHILWSIIVWLCVFYGVGHAVFLGILIIPGWDTELKQNPQEDEAKNRYAKYVLYIRYANYANALLVLLHFTDEAKLQSLYDALQYNGYKRSIGNVLKYILRPLIVLNACANVIFILGIEVLEPTGPSILDYWVPLVPSFATIVIAFFSQSYFLYFDTFVEPANICDLLKVFIADVLVFNWLRVAFTVVKNLVAFLLLPLVAVLTIFMLFARCCCPSLFDTGDSRSLTSRFLRVVAFVSG